MKNYKKRGALFAWTIIMHGALASAVWASDLATPPKPVAPSTVPGLCLDMTEAVSEPPSKTLYFSDLRLFGAMPIKGALVLSEGGTQPNSTRLEDKLLQTSSKKGLVDLINLPGGPQLLIELLLNIDAVKKEATDPFYPQLVLAAANQSVDLRLRYPDPEVNNYLKARRFLVKAERENLEPILPKVSDGQRNSFLYWTALKALDKIRDEDIHGRAALTLVLNEIGRLDETGGVKDSATKTALIKKIISGMKAQADYIPSEFKLADPIDETISEIPWVGLGASVVLQFNEKVIRRNREAKLITMDPAHLPEFKASKAVGWIIENDLYEEVPNTYTVAYLDRDPFGYQPIAEKFLTSFLTDPTLNLFSPQFADEMQRAYPELETIRNREGVTYNTVGIGGSYVDKGPFGAGTFEGYKVMNRAALTLALIRGDKQYFNLTDAEFEKFRTEFLSDLHLLKDGKISLKAVDEYFVFELLDVLGRGRTTFLDSLEKDHHFLAVSGPNYERRSYLILQKYRMASRSFFRLDDARQVEILGWYKFIYFYNMGQVLQLEGGRNTFDRFSNITTGDIAALYYRSLLSFSAVPGGEIKEGSATLNSGVFALWDSFRANIFALEAKGLTPDQAYDEYVKLFGQRLNLPYEKGNLAQETVIRLAAQSRAMTPDQGRQILDDFNKLKPDEQAILIKFQAEYPVLNFGSAELFGQIQKKVKTKPYLTSMRVLAKVYTAISQMGAFKVDEQNNPTTIKEVNVRLITDEIIKGNISRVMKGPFIPTAIDSTYQVQLGDRG